MPVVGAADPLQQPRHALRRADLDHLVDAAPVDAEIERGRGDHRAQRPGRHRRLDLAALLDLQRAVVQRDRQRRVVQLPQRLEHQLRLGAGVDEDDGHPGGADALPSPAAPPPAPYGRTRTGGPPAASCDDLRRRAVGHLDRGGRRRYRPGSRRDARRWRTGRRAARRAPAPRSRATPSASWSPRLVPASAWTSSITMQARRPKKAGASGSESSTARLSGVVSRICGGVARWRARRLAGVSPVRVSMVMGRPIVLHRARQVAGDVGGQRLQRADIERVQAGARGCAPDPPGWAGTRPGSCRRRWARSAARSRRRAAASSIAIWCGRGRPALGGEPGGEWFR